MKQSHYYLGSYLTGYRSEECVPDKTTKLTNFNFNELIYRAGINVDEPPVETSCELKK